MLKLKFKAIFRILFCYEFVLVTGKKKKAGLFLTRGSSDEVYKMIGEYLSEDSETEDAVNEFYQIINDNSKNLY